MFVFTWEFIRLSPVYLSIIGINILKGEGGISFFSYKVVEFFVDIIYESTLGVYEKVLGIWWIGDRDHLALAISFCMCFDFQFYSYYASLLGADWKAGRNEFFLNGGIY